MDRIDMKGLIEMRKLLNPYTPGAGVLPKYLAGLVIRYEAEEALFYIKNGDFIALSFIMASGGVGKTVLLNTIEDLADEEDIRREHLEISSADPLRTAFRCISLS